MEPASVTDVKAELENENARLRHLIMQAGVDAGASDVADKLQKLLIAELHHRVKNLLSMVLSITTQTLRSATSLESASEAIHNRVLILSRSFDLLIEQEMDAIPLKVIIDNATEPYNEADRFAVSVPEVQVAALPALTVALVVNELCTNAVKHGALSHEGGTVDVSGMLSEEKVSLVWAERDGPPVELPSSQSFGTRMIQSIIPGAIVDLDFQPSGLICRIDIPRTSLELPLTTDPLRPPDHRDAVATHQGFPRGNSSPSSS
jgi:two-component sensor histidine kinase